ncbi:hypothetical protein SEA_ALEEMILY_157 [Gordonia phage Aleemily]|uniref:Uncharacterized protein n=1 Tax=Gordonia phage Aleemily TaxID=2965181 RepID=A0A9E7QCQ0_9CAUD|nr:hypothetical protein SEA_ALEEMILY_157 [Gordonia phage Aleemily]
MSALCTDCLTLGDERSFSNGGDVCDNCLPEDGPPECEHCGRDPLTLDETPDWLREIGGLMHNRGQSLCYPCFRRDTEADIAAFAATHLGVIAGKGAREVSFSISRNTYAVDGRQTGGLP